MKRELDFWILGGDLRQAKLAQLLAEDGHSVHTYALQEAGLPGDVQRAEDLRGVQRADCVVLPLPVEREEGVLNAPMSQSVCALEDVLDALRPGQLICGGMVSERIAEMAAQRALTLQDYFCREELAVANAVPAALAV